MEYHIGLVRGSGRCECWSSGHNLTTVVVEARRDKDFLSTDLWKYMGHYETTKKWLRKHKVRMLSVINQMYGTAFTRIIID